MQMDGFNAQSILSWECNIIKYTQKIVYKKMDEW